MWMIWRHVFAVVAVVLSALPAMAQVQQYGWQTLQSTTGTGSGTELDINGYNSVSIDVEMTSTGTVTLKIKGDGSYRDLTCTSAGDTSAALVTSVTSSTQLVCSTFGLSKIQTPITANGGTITVKARVSNTMARRGSVGGGGGGVTLQMNFNGIVGDPAEVGRMAVDAIRQHESRNGSAWRG